MASRFTPEVRGALIERTSAGVPLTDACLNVGVNENTVREWLRKGRRGNEKYRPFLEAVEKARADFKARPEPMDEDELVRVVSEQARKGSVQAMKLRWEMIAAGKQPPEAEPADPLEEFDELAQRRDKRAG